MAWKIIEVDDTIDSDLTDGEFIGISVLLINSCGDPYDENNVYFRAWEKMQDQIQVALGNDS